MTSHSLSLEPFLDALELRTGIRPNRSPNASSPFGALDNALGELSRGRPVILFAAGQRHGDDSRISGILVMAAQFASAEAINLLTSEAKGPISRALPPHPSLELCRLAGLKPAAVFSEILDDSGELADIAGLFDLAQRLDIWILEIGELVRISAKPRNPGDLRAQ